MKTLNSKRQGPTLYPRPLGLAQYFDRMPALGAALRHARETGRRHDVLMEAVPKRLKRFVVAISASGSTLSLTLDSPEAAHLARLLRADMLAHLPREGGKFSEISLRVQCAPSTAPRARNAPSPDAKREMNAVADRMQSERMQTSLRRLAKS